jgi:Na+-transporting NADH:ubiquinone oxidoreductase subunit NqrB
MKQITLSLQQLSGWFLRDARHFQILFLSVFLSYGLLYLSWDFEPYRIGAIIASCLAVQFFWIVKTGKEFHSLKSALITGLGLSMLLKTASVEVAMLAGVIAISSKFLIKYKGKHIFNPANIAIVLTILLTKQAWITPGQWGSSEIILYFFSAAGLMVLLKCGRVDTSLAFLGTYLALDLIYLMLYLGWPADFIYHKYTNGAVLLYAFFMITDPATTPNHAKARIIWAMLIGAVSFYLFQFKHVYGSPIWVLFYMSLLTPLFDKFFVAERFDWFNPNIDSITI